MLSSHVSSSANLSSRNSTSEDAIAFYRKYLNLKRALINLVVRVEKVISMVIPDDDDAGGGIGGGDGDGVPFSSVRGCRMHDFYSAILRIIFS